MSKHNRNCEPANSILYGTSRNFVKINVLHQRALEDEGKLKEAARVKRMGEEMTKKLAKKTRR